MNEIITLIGGILIVGASYAFANGKQKIIANKDKIIFNCEKIIDNDKLIKEIKNKRIKFLEKENKDKDEIIMFDNKLMTKKTEKLEKLDNERCELKIKNFNLEQEMELMVKRGNRKMFVANKLVTGIIRDKVNSLYRDDMKGLEG